MERRAFLTALRGGLLAAPLAAGAQQAGKVYQIGLLEFSAPDAARQALWNVFRQQMRELGFVEGQNLTFEARWAQDDDDRLSKLAAELVSLKMDLIVTAATVSALAAKRATSTIPIVMATGADPVAVGLVANLRQPGGNVTGMTTINSELAAKRLELIRIIAPRASRIAILWDETGSTFRFALDRTEAETKRVGFTIQRVPVRGPAEIEAAFAAMVRGRAGALSIAPSPMFFSHRKRLAELAMKHRLPSIAGLRQYAEDRAAWLRPGVEAEGDQHVGWNRLRHAPRTSRQPHPAQRRSADLPRRRGAVQLPCRHLPQGHVRRNQREEVRSRHLAI
jgi:putative ABC transport system substrate-binding protein